MAWGVSRSFPRAILHIDGDSFFASCEVAKNPQLRGRAVITGKERGIVSACTYEAKRRGVTRGMQLHEVRKLVPDAVILPSDYETYSLFSNRMYKIVRRYTPEVEEYSIDECFADLTGMRRVNKMGYGEMAEAVKRDLERELGMTFSLGVSATKVLAKIGSKWEKPSGLTLIPLSGAEPFLRMNSIRRGERRIKAFQKLKHFPRLRGTQRSCSPSFRKTSRRHVSKQGDGTSHRPRFSFSLRRRISNTTDARCDSRTRHRSRRKCSLRCAHILKRYGGQPPSIAPRA